MEIQVFLLCLNVVAIGGCATLKVATSHYAKPKPNDVLHSANVPLPFDIAWDMLIEGITKNTYVINNIEKVSGLITVAFSSSDVENWVDGGTISYKYGERTFTFNGAGNGKYIYDTKQGQYIVKTYFTRTTSLEAVANVHLKRIKDDLTSISVNTRYVVKIQDARSYQAVNWAGVPQGSGNLSPETLSFTLSTLTPAVSEEESGFTLQSKGVFERYIISLIAPHLAGDKTD